MNTRDLIGIAFGVGYKVAGGSLLGAAAWALGVRFLTQAIGVPCGPMLSQQSTDRVRQLGMLAQTITSLRNPGARASITGRG